MNLKDSDEGKTGYIIGPEVRNDFVGKEVILISASSRLIHFVNDSIKQPYYIATRHGFKVKINMNRNGANS